MFVPNQNIFCELFKTQDVKRMGSETIFFESHSYRNKFQLISQGEIQENYIQENK